MEPTCNGCGAKLQDLDEWTVLYHYTKSYNPLEGHPGNLYCKTCMSKMVFLLRRDFMHAASEEEG